MELVLLIVVPGLLFGFAYWYKKRKKAKAEIPEAGLYAKLVSKKDTFRIWPFPFQTTEELETWWDNNPQLWKEIDRIEIVEKAALWQ